MTASQQDKAKQFHALHGNGQVLVLPNAWDVASARIVEDAGAAAVATTSAGVAWSLGAPDGDQLDRDRAVDLIARIADVVAAPVTADIESGFADSADGVGETIRRVIEAGAVGVNLEDGRYAGAEPLRPTSEQADRIAAARQAADATRVPLFVNARVDVYLRGFGEPAGRLRNTLDRAAAYLAAGADGIFVPGVTDPETITELVRAVAGPVNLMVGPGAPAIGELAALGVARVSVGAAVAEAAYAVARRAASELLTDGTYTAMTDALTYGELNALLQP